VIRHDLVTYSTQFEHHARAWRTYGVVMKLFDAFHHLRRRWKRWRYYRRYPWHRPAD